MKDVYYTGRLNDLGDELCVIEAFSDWGEAGWMVCEEVRAKGREPFISSKIFFTDQNDATKFADNCDVRGYPSV